LTSLVGMNTEVLLEECLTATDQWSAGSSSCRRQSRHSRLVVSVLEIQVDISETARTCRQCRRTEVQTECQQQHEVTNHHNP